MNYHKCLKPCKEGSVLNFIKSISINLIISVLLLSGTLYLTDEWSFLQPYMLMGSLFIIVLIFFLGKYTITVNTKLFIAASLFFISCMVSSLINGDLELLAGALVLYFMYAVLGIIYPSIIRIDGLNRQLSHSFLFLHLPVLIIPVLLTGINQVPYSGIFYNPNSLGNISAITFIIVFSRLAAIIDDFVFSRKINILELLITAVILTGTFLLILYSNSRTSFLTILLICLIYFVMLFSRVMFKKLKLEALTRLILVIIFILTFLYVLILNTGIDEILEATVITKMTDSTDDELSGRTEIWDRAIKDMKPFGNGRHYFPPEDLEGAHSTYISILGQYGTFSAVLFTLFIMIIACYAYIFTKGNKNDRYKYLPFYSTISFMAMSVTEGMMFKASMILVYCIIGVVSTNLKTN